MEFDVYRMADVSTKYITRKDSMLLGQLDAPGHIASIDPVFVDSLSPGDIFTSSVCSDETDRRSDLIAWGFSENFIAILQAAHLQGIHYVRFDMDGGDIGGDVKQFEW